MKHRNMHKLGVWLLVLAAVMTMAPAAALAIGTASGTAVGNTPTLQYSVGGAPQPLYTAPTATFVVDTKVIFTVQKTDGALVQVPPSGNDQALHFQLSNESNASVRFLLTASNLTTGTTITFGGSGYQDSNSGAEVDASDLKACVDANANSACDAGEQFVTVAAGAVAQNVNVLVTGDTPAVAGGQTIGILLTATAVDGAGAALVESASDTAGVDIVLADGAGTNDAARSGTYTDRSAYRIAAAIVSVAKTATTIWDPFNYAAGGATAPGDPKTIPGALIRYTITISNDAAASAPAVLTTVSDTLNANLAIDPNLKVAADNGPLAGLANESAAGSGFKVTGAGAGNTRAIAGAPAYFTTTNGDADGISHDGAVTGGVITAAMATVLPAEGTYSAGELRAGESVTITFNVVVQ